MKTFCCIALVLLFTGRLLAQDCDANLFQNGENFYDTYHHVAADINNWKHYNTHDPTVYKQGEWYYMYSTDASWAGLNKNGAMKRRSKDLVNWEYLGNAFNGVPESAVNFFKETHNPNYTDQGIWAPFLFKLNDKYLLYYSAPGGLEGVNFAYIGYATSDSLNGPWQDQGMITYSYRDNINAIDPTVTFDSISNQMWMAYGSWFSGIYMLELNPETGGIKTTGDRGKRIANRQYNYLGQEGPELTYRNGWYYLFQSYDGLGDLYNVRVGRSRNAAGPYYDFNGVQLTSYSDNKPMVLAPYKFKNHFGWVGTGHCGVYNDDGNYYMFHQGRPAIEPAMMVLHVRKIVWIDDWPMVSPERYAGVQQCSFSKDSLIGNWEHLALVYHNSTNGEYKSNSTTKEFSNDGSIIGGGQNSWQYLNDTLFFSWNNGDLKGKAVVFWGYDSENDCRTLLYSGIDSNGQCFWGKKIVPQASERYTKLIDGASYTIQNLLSHLYMRIPNDADVKGVSVSQGADKGLTSQYWRLKYAGPNYYYLLPQHSEKNMALEVRNGLSTNGTDIQLGVFDGSDKQKFKITYNNNGYFRILTKVSNNVRCADVNGFSIYEGGNIFQWEYLGGLNQMWRFEKSDLFETDTTSYETAVAIIEEPQNEAAISIYPNPSVDGMINICYSNIDNGNEYELSIYNLNGKKVYTEIVGTPSVSISHNLNKGVYLLCLKNQNQSFVQKLIVP